VKGFGATVLLGLHVREGSDLSERLVDQTRGVKRMGEGLFQPQHLLVIFLIAVLVFGPKRLPELGRGLGEAIRGFKDSFKAGETTPPVPPPGTTALPDTKSPSAPPEQPKG
jgi:sec-independent protein translocase protein TatA